MELIIIRRSMSRLANLLSKFTYRFVSTYSPEIDNVCSSELGEVGSESHAEKHIMESSYMKKRGHTSLSWAIKPSHRGLWSIKKIWLIIDVPLVPDIQICPSRIMILGVENQAPTQWSIFVFLSFFLSPKSRAWFLLGLGCSFGALC